MANVAVTYTFSNSTTADATQVNQNFTDLINGTSDGTKDFSISALTCAGTATLNGNVTLGNSTSDDITVTGSLASTINIKTTNLYNIGSSTVGLLSVYFGSSAGAYTTRLIGAAAAASYTFTLPTDGGAAGKFLRTNGSGTTSWTYPTKIVTKTTTYTATGDETHILCSASGGNWTLTLPAASDYTDKELTIVKTDSTTGLITIDGNGTETINGATGRKLATQYESVTIISNGSNWFVTDHFYNKAWTSYTPTFTNISVTSSEFWCQRNGDSANIKGSIKVSSVSGEINISLPSGWALDTTKAEGYDSTTDTFMYLAPVVGYDTSANIIYEGIIQFSSSSTSTMRILVAEGASGTWNATTPFTWASTDYINMRIFGIPIANWEG